MPQINKRAILETLERPTLERLVVLTMERREEHNLAVYCGNPWTDDALEGERMDLSAPHTDGELVDFIMKDRLMDAHDVIMALHARELRWACKVLGVLDRPAPKAELREYLIDAVGRSVARPMPTDQPAPRFDEATQDWVYPDWDARRLRWVWPEGKAPPEGHDLPEDAAAAASEPGG